MRVMFDGRTFGDHFPGIGRYAFNLARALAAGSGRLDLTILHDPLQPNTRFDLTRLAAAPGVSLVAAAAPVFALSTQLRLPRQLRELGGDVYHSPYYLMPYWPGLPTVLTLYDLIPFRYPAYYTALTRLAFALAIRMAVRAASRIIALSQAGAEELQQVLSIARERIIVVNAAPDPIFVPQPPATVADARRRLGLPDRYLLYFGSNKPHKNLPRLVQAYRGLGSGSGAVALVIAGQWYPRHRLARATADQSFSTNGVLLLGPVAEANLPALYAGADAFVFPSLYEGFGLPPLEAMACGTPVLCAQGGSLAEVATDAALLFDPHNVGAMTDAMARILGDAALREELRERGLARASQYTWSEAARRTLEVYEAVTGAH